jgi:flagellar FliL protein
MPDDVNDELVAEEKKSSKLPLILGVLTAFIVGGAAGFGGSSFMGGGDESAESGEEGGEDGKDGEDGPAPGLFNLGLFTVNLRGTGGGRVVRMEIQVQTEAGLVDGLEERKPEFRHAIITMVSDYSYSDLEGLDGKTRLADELLTRLNRLMDGGRINRLYFVQFVVQ